MKGGIVMNYSMVPVPYYVWWLSILNFFEMKLFFMFNVVFFKTCSYFGIYCSKVSRQGVIISMYWWRWRWRWRSINKLLPQYKFDCFYCNFLILVQFFWFDVDSSILPQVAAILIVSTVMTSDCVAIWQMSTCTRSGNNQIILDMCTKSLNNGPCPSCFALRINHHPAWNLNLAFVIYSMFKHE